MYKCFFKAAELERGGPVVDWTLLAIFFFTFIYWKYFKMIIESCFCHWNQQIKGSIWTCSFKKLHKSSLQTNRNITKKCFGFFAIPYERNDRHKSGTWRYPRHAAGRINMPRMRQRDQVIAKFSSSKKEMTLFLKIKV